MKDGNQNRIIYVQNIMVDYSYHNFFAPVSIICRDICLRADF